WSIFALSSLNCSPKLGVSNEPSSFARAYAEKLRAPSVEDLTSKESYSCWVKRKMTTRLRGLLTATKKPPLCRHTAFLDLIPFTGTKLRTQFSTSFRTPWHPEYWRPSGSSINKGEETTNEERGNSSND